MIRRPARKPATPAAPTVAPVKRRRFLCRLLVEIEVDERLLADVLTDEWRSLFYRSVQTAGDVADHLAYNLVQDRHLSSLDGFADQPEDRAIVLHIETEDPAEEIEPQVSPAAKTRTRRKT